MGELPAAFWTASAFALGACIGSFLNVVIWRLPRGESLVSPPSHCPACDAPIPPWANVPLFSYVLLGGRCRDCKTTISPRYPLVELFTALVFAGLVWVWGPSWRLGVELAMASSLIAVAGIDWDHKRIPNEITYPGIVIGLLCAWFVPPSHAAHLGHLIGSGYGFWIDALIAVVVCGGFLWALAAGYERLRGRMGLGLGDVKLVAMFGAFLGLQRTLGIIVLGSLFGIVYGVAWILYTRGDPQTRIPFGPGLAGAALVDLFVPALFSRFLALIS